MMKKLLILLIPFVVSACSSDGDTRPEYMDSNSVEALQIPPQLTPPDATDELEIPRPSQKALDAFKHNQLIKGTVAPKFSGIQLKSDDGLYWLEINEDADKLWPTLKDFWANEGIKVARDEPLLGFMETDWVNHFDVKEKMKPGLFKRIISALDSDYKDVFRLRVERVDSTPVATRVYISHRGLQAIVEGDDVNWIQRWPQPQYEKELLYRLTLFLGITKLDADKLFLAYQPAKLRIKPVRDEEHLYDMVGDMDFVWRRLLVALDEAGVDVLQQDQQQHSIKVEFTRLPSELIVDPDADIEVTQDDKPVTVLIGLTPGSGSVRIKFSNEDGGDLSSGKPDRLETVIVKLLNL